MPSSQPRTPISELRTPDSILTLGFSPCPNDTFIFDALVNNKIDSDGLKFRVVMEDVETLNNKAARNELDVTKISFAAYLNLTKTYQLLNSGSALGMGVGPLLISKSQISKSQFPNLKTAIPGKNTTANFLFSIFFPEAKNKIEMIFSEIEDAVLSGKADAGVIIHENRFTYEKNGLKKVCDLGELWEKETGEPIPLGGIAVKRSLPAEVRQKVDRLVRKSVEYAFANPSSSYNYVKQHAQEMDEDVRKKHIALYVNEYSIDLGTNGRHAIKTMFEKAVAAGITSSSIGDIFFSNLELPASNFQL